jgi:pSer/pThr/pTyr-binding forkhead associated (FHA) protein
MTPAEPDDEGRDDFPFPHDQLEAGQALLLVKRGPNAGSTFMLGETTEAGRDPSRAVFLDDITVSRQHATFEHRADGSWFVRDEGSLNGTYVNGEQVEETKLAEGDEVQIGKFKLTFFAAGE